MFKITQPDTDCQAISMSRLFKVFDTLTAIFIIQITKKSYLATFILMHHNKLTRVKILSICQHLVNSLFYKYIFLKLNCIALAYKSVKNLLKIDTAIII